MRPQICLLLFVLAMPLVAQEDPRIVEGIALHDARKYDEAIAKYKAVLADDPANELAKYELALSYQAKGDHAQCRAVAEPLVETAAKYRLQLLTTLGNCLDAAGEPQKALEVYKRAMALAPDNPTLLYNYAVTLVGTNQISEARATLKKAVAARPSHTSSRYLLGRVFEAEGFRAPALLEYLRFLSLEPSTARAKDAAARTVALLNHGVERTGPKNINITVDPKPRSEEGDFKGWETILALSAGARMGEENAKKSDFEANLDHLVVALLMLAESPGGIGPVYTATQNVPFFVELHERKLLEPFAAVALSSLQLKGSEEWRKLNEKKLADYQAFMAEQQKR